MDPPSPITPTNFTVDETVNEIISYLKKSGTESYLGPQEESVTQLSHSLQAAEQAKLYTSDEDVIIAALLHDIGHMILSKPDSWDIDANSQSEQHEWVGHDYLRRHGFSQKVADLVLGHVEAKRYLTYKEPGYYDQLSDASKMTLIGQGGPFTAAEALHFEQSPLLAVKLLMRRWDEAAKVIDWKEKGTEFAEYSEMIRRHLECNQTVRHTVHLE